MDKEYFRSFYTSCYMINESLFGQSEPQLLHMFKETDITLNIDFSNCYLLLTGINKVLYESRSWFTRNEILQMSLGLKEYLLHDANVANCQVEYGVVNYDVSKLFIIVISPQDSNFNIKKVAMEIFNFFTQQYKMLVENLPENFCNIMAVSQHIKSYEEYHKAFLDVKRLYKQSFFVFQDGPLYYEEIESCKVHYSLVEVKKDIRIFEDALYRVNEQDAISQLKVILLQRTKYALDIDVYNQVITNIYKSIFSVSLSFGLFLAEDNNLFPFYREDYLDIKEVYYQIVAFINKLIPALQKSSSRPGRLSRQAIAYIQNNYYYPIGLSNIAEHLNVNSVYLSRVFKCEIGLGISQYISKLRVDKAKELLRNTNLKVSEIASEVGLSSSHYFSVTFKNSTGLRPMEYREQYSK